MIHCLPVVSFQQQCLPGTDCSVISHPFSPLIQVSEHPRCRYLLQLGCAFARVALSVAIAVTGVIATKLNEAHNAR